MDGSLKKYVYFVDPKCKYGARKVLSVLICGAFIFSSNPDEVFFILMFPIKLSLFSLLTDLFMALLFPIYWGIKIRRNFYFMSDFDSLFFFRSPITFPVWNIQNRFDITRVVSEIIGVKGSKKGPTPKVITLSF